MWRSSTGAIVEVDTVEIEYLREMRLMYEAVCNSTLTEERVRALHLLKRTASYYFKLFNLKLGIL